jgi:hypothetical protein
MGTFAHSYVVVGCSPEDLLAFYRTDGTRAFIFPDDRNTYAICDDNDDEPDLDLLIKLSDKLQARVFLGQVFDSAVFVATIINLGKVIDQYVDYPEYLPGLAFSDPILNLNRDFTVEQRAVEWTAVFDAPQQENVLADLFRQRSDHLFAEDFHEAVLQVLKLSTAMVGQYFVEIEKAFEDEPEAQNVLLFANGEA